VRFWDSSALLPLLVWEPSTAAVQALVTPDVAMMAGWHSRLECAASLAALERDRTLTARAAAEAFRRLDALWSSLYEVQCGERLRLEAMKFLRLHAIRAADALQLGAALVVSRENPASLEFVCLDDRLRAAAMREGFQVLPR
jgi:uncharacterized protein